MERSVPLSEHEQRLLDQIERQLYADDPKFASAVRSHDLKSHLSRRVKRFAAVLVLGVAALVAGAVIHNVVVGVAGFLLMLAAALVIARTLQRLSRGDSYVAGRGKGPRGPKSSFRERAEERFRRRFEDRDR
jgi:NaMN:DMB phosphoribosyltransferase